MGNNVSFNATVRGLSHERSGMPCQDSAGSMRLENLRCHVIAVADGHGDPSCPRSARGSELAIQVALDQLGSFAQGVCDERGNPVTPSADFDLKSLSDAIVTAWGQAVAEDYAHDPLPGLDEAVASNPDLPLKTAREHLYGTTLVAALVMPHACVLVQQGDGCCAAIFGDGTLAENEDLIEPDELCVGNVTTSLSDLEASDEIRSTVIELTDTRQLIACYVGTDGIDKSLRARGTSDYVLGLTLDRLEEKDANAWQATLTRSIDQLSRAGSGDDASLAGYINLAQAKAIEQRLSDTLERHHMRAELDSLRLKQQSMQRKREYYQSSAAQQIPEQERTAYLSEYDAITQRIKGIERDLDERVEQPASNVAPTPAASPEMQDVPTTPLPAPAQTSRLAQDATVALEQPTQRREPVPSAAPETPVHSKNIVSASRPAHNEVTAPIVDVEPTHQASEHPRSTSRRTGLLLFAGLAVAATLAGGAFALLRTPAATGPAQTNTQPAPVEAPPDDEATPDATPRDYHREQEFLHNDARSRLNSLVAQDERLNSLEGSGIDGTTFLSSCGAAIDAQITEVQEVGPNEREVTFTLAFNGPNLGVKLDEICAIFSETGDIGATQTALDTAITPIEDATQTPSISKTCTVRLSDAGGVMGYQSDTYGQDVDDALVNMLGIRISDISTDQVIPQEEQGTAEEPLDEMADYTESDAYASEDESAW